jgi:hypothetical protein
MAVRRDSLTAALEEVLPETIAEPPMPICGAFSSKRVP